VRRVLTATAAVGLGWPGVAAAGMPSITLGDVARLRLQTISFFLFGLLACSWAIQGLWNLLRADVPRLPRLSYSKALGVVVLWGLLFVLVLTMISGARELMTPGAWKKQGLTYRLADEPGPARPVEVRPEADRRWGLERLRSALWSYARAHGGRFPPVAETPEIAEDLWRVPDLARIRYLYVPGRSADLGAELLAYEPGLFGPDRLVLLTNGAIESWPPDRIRNAPGAEKP
jgi:hypothetical protein